MPQPRARHCPSCAAKTLKPTSNPAILGCSQCQGLWFEDGSLNQAIAQEHDCIDQYDHELHLGPALRVSERICISCRVSMTNYQLLVHYTTEIDCCPACDGVWLDKHEIDQVMHSPKLKQALTDLNQKVSWKSWLFQFLTAMPAEYNVAPQRTPWVTRSLVVLCSLIFGVGVLSPEANEWIFANLALNSDTQNPAHFVLQLLAYQFVHGGLMHLVGNMYFLWIIGDNLEDALGHGAFLVIYLFAGIMAALAELLLFNTSQGPLLLVGASGAIAALFGLYLVWFRHASLTFMIIIYQKKLAPHWYFLIWSLINIAGMVSGQGGVAWVAHLGGFGLGLLLGYLLKDYVLRKNPLIAMLNQPEAVVRR
ncbi:rhomboid family intramembrane serine protease [Marinobacter sediminicola]|uniref:rhomboid family intramembrane serine protease n=1 Tax=Marinobacter sediminicola TaxID=3072994 RepID=UPI0028126247|nr:rhomboid family intramembrane serine protease [Marinobacter sp. F26243]